MEVSFGPMGMYSMNRTSTGWRRVSSRKGAGSSLIPRITTTFTFTGLKSATAVSSPFITAARSPPRVMAW